MPVFDPQSDPMAFMSFLAESDWTKSTLKFPVGKNWVDMKDHLTANLDKVLRGRFIVMLGDESKLTDYEAEYIIRTEHPDDLAFVGAYLLK